MHIVLSFSFGFVSQPSVRWCPGHVPLVSSFFPVKNGFLYRFTLSSFGTDSAAGYRVVPWCVGKISRDGRFPHWTFYALSAPICCSIILRLGEFPTRFARPLGGVLGPFSSCWQFLESRTPHRAFSSCAWGYIWSRTFPSRSCRKIWFFWMDVSSSKWFKLRQWHCRRLRCLSLITGFVR